MNRIASRRTEIYDYFHSSPACQRHFLDPANEAVYVAYYNSMYLLQDATESLQQHRSRGFSDDPLSAYLEFWGVMQAVIIQQDSIAELHEVTVGQALDTREKNLQSWLELRELRNVCAGHPVKKDRPKSSPVSRTFMGRGFGSYESIKYERWQEGLGVSHPEVPFGALLDAYTVEAEAQLCEVLSAMKSRWP